MNDPGFLLSGQRFGMTKAERGHIMAPGKPYTGGRRTEAMSERNSDRKEKDWTDEIPDEEEQRPDPWEETYRDGSAKHECWESEGR